MKNGVYWSVFAMYSIWFLANMYEGGVYIILHSLLVIMNILMEIRDKQR